MEDKDNIKDLFNEKLNGFEANVRPELWANISSQIGATSTATTVAVGMSLLTKSIIGISIAAAIGGITFFALKYDSSNKTTTVQDTISKQESSPTIQTPELNQNTEKSADSGVKIKRVEENSSPVERIQELNTSSTETNEFGQVENRIINNDVKPEVNKTTSHNSSTMQEDKNVSDKNETNPKETIVNNSSTPIENQQESTIEEEAIGKLTNIFTPNGDRVNDYLSVESNNVSDFSIVVLDPNNKIVYQSNEANFIWDGIGINGEMVPKGNYVYYVTARDQKGKLISKHSVLRIER